MNKLLTGWMKVSLAVLATVAAAGCGAEPIAAEDAEPSASEGALPSASEDNIAQAASALTGVHKVCRYATVRRTPGGQVFGFLSAGENFDIYRHCGTHSDGSYCAWYYGHAYGHVHEDGWIEESAFSGC